MARPIEGRPNPAHRRDLASAIGILPDKPPDAAGNVRLSQAWCPTHGDLTPFHPYRSRRSGVSIERAGILRMPPEMDRFVNRFRQIPFGSNLLLDIYKDAEPSRLRSAITKNDRENPTQIFYNINQI